MRLTEENDGNASVAPCGGILAGVIRGETEASERSMNELAALADAAGISVLGEATQTRETPDRATYLGKGKTEELREIIEATEAELVICNDELSGIQIRNLEERLGVRVIDRTILILDIFAARAASKEGKLQVELAQLQYRLPRLTGFGKSLSRLGGGIGTRGPGEKKLETDRRHIMRRTEDIKRELDAAAAHRRVQRVGRERSGIPTAALVGYTNTGKSALMNALLRRSERVTGAVPEKDMLFATLDTFRRRIVLPDNRAFVLTDTVGFVSKLPHTLIKAFRATLEAATEADLLIHVTDAASEDRDFRVAVVREELAAIGLADKPCLTVFNKADLLKRPSDDMPRGDAVFTSAVRGDNLDRLTAMIAERLFRSHRDARLLIPYERGDIVSRLSDETPVRTREYTESGVLIETRLSEADFHRLSVYTVPTSTAANRRSPARTRPASPVARGTE